MKETRIYEITGKSEQLEVLEQLFKHIEHLGSIGASREIPVYVDGDGEVQLKFKKEKENGYEEIPTIRHDELPKKIGYGIINPLKDGNRGFDLG